MGLDQFAVARKGEPVEKDGRLEWPERKELADWRKHPNLQGWMEDLYRRRGGEREDFNCVEVELTLGDLDDLEKAVKGKDMPQTEGFFFGGDSDEYYRSKDLQFIEDAREAIEDGWTVVYDSWW